jgi:type II restriction enzyme
LSNKHELREQRYNTIINKISKKQEKQCSIAVLNVVDKLNSKFPILLEHESNTSLVSIVNELSLIFQDVTFAKPLGSSSMRPDGGVLYLVSNDNRKFPILITEVKNQGTNDLRAKEGKPRQAQGNAIERLGKNVIGFRTYLLNEGIFPFVCFGYGCDFADGSSILDRVITINMFGELNQTNVMNVGPKGIFNRGSFYFREPKWTVKEMTEIMYDISVKSVHYYFSKYGEEKFI